MTSVHHWSSKIGHHFRKENISDFQVIKKLRIKSIFLHWSLNMKKNQKDSVDLVCWKFTLKVRHFLMGQSKWKYFSKSDFGQNLLTVNPCPQETRHIHWGHVNTASAMYYHMISTTVITNQYYRFSGVDNLRISYTYDLAAN